MNFPSAVKRVWEDDHFSWEGGESNVIAQQRGVRSTYQVLDKYNGKSIVVGTHGNIMALIMNYFDHQYDFLFWKSLDMPDIYQLSFDGRRLKNVRRLWKR